MSLAPDRAWVKAALEIMKKLRSADKNVKLFFCVKVPAPTWSQQLTQSYLSIIHHVTDLGTIEQALKDGRYVTPDEWVAQVRTVFRNAFVFNDPRDATSKAILDCAENASKIFEKEMMRLRGVVVI